MTSNWITKRYYMGDSKMKTINTILISGLVAFSLGTPVSATSFEDNTTEMNRILENRIESQIQHISEFVNVELEVSAETVKVQALNSTAASHSLDNTSKRS